MSACKSTLKKQKTKNKNCALFAGSYTLLIFQDFILFTISVETHFQASHQLTLPDGSKEPLHQHNWLVTADVSSDKLNSMGLVMDFHQLKAMVDNIVAEFENGQLNKIDYFQQNSSSAETVAKYVYEELAAKLPKGIELESVRVVEEPSCSAKFGKSH